MGKGESDPSATEATEAEEIERCGGVNAGVGDGQGRDGVTVVIAKVDFRVATLCKLSNFTVSIDHVAKQTTLVME